MRQETGQTRDRERQMERPTKRIMTEAWKRWCKSREQSKRWNREETCQWVERTHCQFEDCRVELSPSLMSPSSCSDNTLTCLLPSGRGVHTQPCGVAGGGAYLACVAALRAMHVGQLSVGWKGYMEYWCIFKHVLKVISCGKWNWWSGWWKGNF